MTTKMLGIRLPRNMMLKYETIAQQNNESVHQLAKKALIEWIEVLFTSRNLNMIIIPKTTLLKMIPFLPEEQISVIGHEIAQHIIEYFQFLFKTHITHFSKEMLLNIISKFMGASGVMWFDHVEFQLKSAEEISTLQVSHKSGQEWSQFTFIILKKIIEESFTAHILSKSTFLGENSIRIEFQAQV